MTLADLLELVKSGGGILAPIFAILWWLERDERRDTQQELKQVAEKSTAAMVEMKSLVGILASIFKSGTG